MKIEFDKNNAHVLAVALDSVLPSFVIRDIFTEEDVKFLFNLEQRLLSCNGFSIQFNCEENNG